MLEAADPDQPTLIPPRSDAYYDAMAEHGIDVDPLLVVRNDWGGEQGARSMGRLLSLRQPPTAVYAHSDEVALGAIRTLRRAGLRIPQDMSVIGIDDHPLAELTDLTTVRQDPRQQGIRTAEMLIGLLQGRADVDQATTLPTELIIRGSTAPPPGGAIGVRSSQGTRRGSRRPPGTPDK
jgi:DNA-binding LacI/PurR family transcriptional regulator